MDTNPAPSVAPDTFSPAWFPVPGACGLYSADWPDGTIRMGRRGQGGQVEPYSARWSAVLLGRHDTAHTTARPGGVTRTLYSLARGQHQYDGR